MDKDDPRAIRRTQPIKLGKGKGAAMAQKIIDMVDYWGAECRDVHAGCPTCEAWRIFYATQKKPTDQEVQDACQSASI
jgi:hypothetical protein